MRIAVDIPQYVAMVWPIVSGALRYEAQDPDVNVVWPSMSMATPEHSDVTTWDGMICTHPRPELDIPQVIVSSNIYDGYPNVSINNHEVVQVAVDQFLAIGITNLAFFGGLELGPCRVRWKCFSEYVESRGFTPVFVSSVKSDNPHSALLELQKPCGILAFDELNAFTLLGICKEINLSIPRDVQVISAGDQPKCRETIPTLSSIVMPFESIGLQAARLCAKMIRGEAVESLQMSPSGLIIRDSINVETGDIRTAAAIAHFLRANLSYPIQMEDVVRRSSMARRRLEQIFQKSYGVSPMAYLRELRMKKVIDLLESGDAPLKDIVNECGYSSSIHLCYMFKKAFGMSPMAYRKKYRGE